MRTLALATVLGATLLAGCATKEPPTLAEIHEQAGPSPPWN